MIARLFALLFAASLLVIVSCQAIVTGDVPAYKCAEATPGACPTGQFCKGTGCVECKKTDICDHYDDDCNGIVDDGPISDADNDGFTWCGKLDLDGHPQEVDCDDNNPNVHPIATEACNGLDDDCNGSIDDGACSMGVCTKTGQCNNTPCDPKTDDPCDKPSGETCDPDSLTCIPATKSKVGQGCATTNACETGLFCGFEPALTNRIVKPPYPGVCTKTCCTSRECDAGFVCYAPGTGGRYCAKASLLSRPANDTGLSAGEPATTADKCRSGLLYANRCADTCCSDSDCTQGTACVLDGKLDGHFALACHLPVGTGVQGDDCFSNGSADCRAAACVTGPYECVVPCCGSTTCGTLYAGFLQASCYYGQASGGSEYAPLCMGTQNGKLQLGAKCTSSGECRSGRCFDTGTEKYCSDVCCRDSDCGVGYLCRPSQLFLVCQKKGA